MTYKYSVTGMAMGLLLTTHATMAAETANASEGILEFDLSRLTLCGVCAPEKPKISAVQTNVVEKHHHKRRDGKICTDEHKSSTPQHAAHGEDDSSDDEASH
ncbi:MAG: hypothetical protein V4482_00335 [Pseudomonadota bacterium]